MKSKKWLLLLLAAPFIGHANGDEIQSGKTITFYPKGRQPVARVQRELSQSASWRNFEMNHGDWWVRFNEDNQLPHRAFGRGIRVSGYTPAQRAQSFINQDLVPMGMKNITLSEPKVTINSHHDFVDYTQIYQGIEVWNSRLMIQMARNGEVLCFGADIYPNIHLDVTPKLNAEKLRQIAQDKTEEKILDTEKGSLKIIAIPGGSFALVQEIIVTSVDQDKIPYKWFTLVDAHNGKIWYRQDLIDHATKELVVMGQVSVNTFITPKVNTPLPNLWMEQNAIVSFSDSSGKATFNNITAATNTTIRLKGKYSTVQLGGTTGRTPSFTYSMQPTASTDTLYFDGQGSGADTATQEAINAYYHVNVVHDYMKRFYPTFNSMDNSLPTNIDLTSGTCNAFYNGSSINFYKVGAGCPSFANIADVIYHEYGHGINDKYYQSGGFTFQNGSMGEGYADTWAIGITNDPILGKASTLGQLTSFIRRYDINPKVYPQDIQGEVHADGEIIAGAWWDVGVNMGNQQQKMALYAETFDAHPNGPTGNEGEVYTDVLVAALMADDNDNNILNGTPHSTAILQGFARHGLTLLSSVDLLHTPVDMAASAAPIPYTATFLYAGSNTNFLWQTYLAGAKVIYRINNNNHWDTTNLVQAGTSGVYNGNIPAQSAGTLISYYITGYDIFGSPSAIQPNGTANLPFFTLVGFTNKRTEDFDVVQSPGWQTGLTGDNAATGIWEFATPIGSYITPSDPNSIVQPSQDATGGSGTDCAVTQNAPTASSAAGTADVDAGVTTLKSPAFNLTTYTQPVITYSRWYSNSQGANPGNDPWIVEISNDNSTWVSVERTYVPDRNWRRNAIRVRDYVTPNATVYLRFRASDSTLASGTNNGQSLVEAGVDDVGFYDLTNNPNGAQDLSNISSFEVYPNPAGDNTTLAFETLVSQHGAIKIFDASGRMVDYQNLGLMSVGKHRYQIQTSALANGIYQVQLETGMSKAQVKRIKVQH